jgi:hypothetical protein
VLFFIFFLLGFQEVGVSIWAVRMDLVGRQEVDVNGWMLTFVLERWRRIDGYLDFVDVDSCST